MQTSGPDSMKSDGGMSGGPGGGTMLRSVAAVAAGFALLAIGVMIATRIAVALMLPAPDAGPTPAYLVVNLAYSAGLAVVAGYVTAKAAPSAPRGHALALAGVLLVLGVAGVVGTAAAGATPPGQPSWYPYVMLALGPAGAILGGSLRAASAARRA
jgi:hypothetical protein